MKEIAITRVEDAGARVEVSRGDLVEAWTLLENLVVSLDRIGSVHGREIGEAYDAKRAGAFYEEVGRFICEREVVERLGSSRGKLGAYLSDDDAESLSDRIAFWHKRAAS